MRLTVITVALSLVAGSAAAEDIAFVESSSELDDGKPATSMWNAVDGKDTTSWCTKPGAEAQTAVLSFGFEKAVTVTHLALVVGAVKGDALDKTKKRARIVYVADVEHRVEAKFKDDAGVQTLELTPPAKGKRIVVEILGAYEGATPDAPLCVGEVTLKSKSDTLTGATIASKLRGLNTPSKKLLHEWLDDVSAPQRTLLMNVDGTFTYRFEPLLEGKPARLKGKWTATGNAITFEVGGKSTRVAARLTQIADSDDHVVELVLSGDAPHPSMAATYRPAPSRLP